MMLSRSPRSARESARGVVRRAAQRFGRQVARAYARADRFGLADDLFERAWRAWRRAGDRLRARAGQQFVEQQSELIHIRRDRDGLAADLLGARVVRREDARGRAGRRAVVLLVRGQQPRDPEVEEDRMAIGRHDDVRRLDVAMDDELAMRLLQGGADVREELEALVDGQPLFVAEAIDVASLDVLHHEIRPAIARVRRRAAARCADD